MFFPLQRYCKAHLARKVVGCKSDRLDLWEAWEWSTDHRTLRFTAQTRLQERLRYHLHLGGGIADVDGHPLNFEHTMEFHHAAWCDDTGSMHQFMNTNQWRHQNGMFGVFLEFTTGS
jgi:hypothetical protein